MQDQKIQVKQQTQMPSAYITHGGGPIPILDPQGHTAFYNHLRMIHDAYPKPAAIVVISAHWQEKEFTILDQDRPGLFFDYYGFPPETYKFNYNASSTKELRKRVIDVVASQGFNLKTKGKRGYDHGVFIPLMIMYPKADIPVIQISLEQNLNPRRHYLFGQALASLRRSGFLILGSGASFHSFGNSRAYEDSQIFDQQLGKFCVPSTKQKRLELVEHWESLKCARKCHSRQEHLVPLFVCSGASEGSPGHQVAVDMMGVKVSDIIYE